MGIDEVASADTHAARAAVCFTARRFLVNSGRLSVRTGLGRESWDDQTLKSPASRSLSAPLAQRQFISNSSHADRIAARPQIGAKKQKLGGC
jgi:hypothetical protein